MEVWYRIKSDSTGNDKLGTDPRGRILLREGCKYETVSKRDSVWHQARKYSRITMKVMFSNSRLYLSSLDSLSASRRVLDQP